MDGPGERRTGTMDVLLVEDSDTFRRVVMALLQADGGATVRAASTLEEARRLHAAGTPDVILLDLGLPDSEGIDTFLTLHAHVGEVPIVVLSGQEDQSLAIRTVDAGAQDYLVKAGLQRDRLVRALRYAIERQRRMDADNRARQAFFAAISHEFRTPLSSLLLQADLVLRGDGTDDPRDLAARVQTTGRALALLVDDILDLTKFLLEEPSVTRERIALGEVTAQVRAVIDPLAVDAGVTTTWEVAEDATAYADPVKLRQVLLNLTSNAVKYTPRGGSMRCRARRLGAEVVIEVHDTGVGIPPGAIDKLFQPFFRVESTRTQQGQASTGLGLAVTHRLVKAHGGRIDVASEPGRGTTFTVRLPARA